MFKRHKDHDHGHSVLPVRLFVKIFFVLLAFIFVNIGISMLDISNGLSLVLLMSVAIIQTLLVGLFFMELIHEDLFYTLAFGSAILFMILFFAITLVELNHRAFFNAEEDVHLMREVDKKGNFAPAGPKIKAPEEGHTPAPHH